jgi:hypothetical protein
MDTSFSPEDTPDLIERLKRGDLAANDPMMRRHEEEMLTIARRHLHGYGVRGYQGRLSVTP